MGFLETSDLAQAASFRSRLLIGVVRVAGTVLAEDQSAMGLPRSEKRSQLAAAVMRGPAAYVDQFIWPVLANPAIAEAGLESSDDDLEYQITESWDQVAGVTRAEREQPGPEA